VHRFRLTLFSSLAVALSVLMAVPCRAEPSWKTLLSFKGVKADPDAPYELTREHGPWMIFAAAFAGAGARGDAHELVLELRDRFSLAAFVYHKNYDFKDSFEGLGLDRFGNPKKMKFRHSVAYEEYAVLVGNFQSLTEPPMEKALKTLKFCQPNCFAAEKGKNTTLRFFGLRSLQKKLNGNPEKHKKGPLGSSFKTRNPMLPRDFFVDGGPDSFVLGMNKGVKYSLLNCPGKFSVRVATFRGNVVIDQAKIQEITNQTDRLDSKLARAAEKAHLLTTQLRQRKVEAYEFHDRHESIVAIGSFDLVGTPRSDGKTEINPSILRIMNSYGPEKKSLPGTSQAAGIMPRSLGGIPFDIQPTPVEVPKQSAASKIAKTSSR